ncbi:hypothetical protein LCGC14_2922770, partial [marine sediment metagenome]
MAFKATVWRDGKIVPPEPSPKVL